MTDEFGDLARLEADLRRAPEIAKRNIDKALEVTARNVKDDWKQGAEVGAEKWNYADDYAASITYDMQYSRDTIEAEIGPQLGRPGGSAGFLEDAPGKVLASPQHAGRDALEANEPDFIRGLEEAILDALEE